MKLKYLLLLVVISLFFVSCSKNEPDIDWTGSAYYLSGFNDYYIQYGNNIGTVRLYDDEKRIERTYIYEHGKLIKLIDSSREELFKEYIYDENCQKIIEEYLVVEDEKVSDIHYSYEFDKNTKEKITTLTDENGIKTIFKEVKRKSGIYECEVSHENKYDKSKKWQEHKTAKFNKSNIIEYTQKDRLLNEVYRFDYKKNNLTKLSYYDGKSQSLIFTYDYEYENDKLCQVTCKRHNNPSTKEEIIYTIFFSDFDSHGNWRKYERVYGENDRSIIHREIEYVN